MAMDWPRKLKHGLHGNYDLVLQNIMLYNCKECTFGGVLWTCCCQGCDSKYHPNCALGKDCIIIQSKWSWIIFEDEMEVCFSDLVSPAGFSIASFLVLGYSTKEEFGLVRLMWIIFEDEMEVCFSDLGGWESFFKGLGIIFFEMVSVMGGFLSGVLCFGFSI
ncbi:putative nucleoredoxin 1 [Quercus suber]|uniref:Nucleoredoxin 1 n=1 Tax=Quercus suber TaxID=58331 RepID=A0AAW0LXM6_QUESU